MIKFDNVEENFGEIPLEDIILEWVVNKINKDKGYEFVRIIK